MLLVACAIFVPRLKGDTAGHINSSHRGETLRDERPYLYLSFQGVEFLLSKNEKLCKTAKRSTVSDQKFRESLPLTLRLLPISRATLLDRKFPLWKGS